MLEHSNKKLFHWCYSKKLCFLWIYLRNCWINFHPFHSRNIIAYTALTVFYILYSSFNKCQWDIWHVSTGEYNGEICPFRVQMTFLHWRYQCTHCQGHQSWWWSLSDGCFMLMGQTMSFSLSANRHCPVFNMKCIIPNFWQMTCAEWQHHTHHNWDPILVVFL